MIKIMFVCHGNICRSPMAEFVMKDIVKKHQVESKYEIISAATSTEEIGNDIHYGTKCKLDEMHIYYTRRRAFQMRESDYDAYDYLIGMDDANIRNMMRICKTDSNHKIKTLLSFCHRKDSIADPWYTGNFDKTYQDVKEGCEALFAYIEEKEH